jgi:hypothetical protein
MEPELAIPQGAADMDHEGDQHDPGHETRGRRVGCVHLLGCG